ncbi:MAG: hypothetical protein ACRC8Z_03635 [Empedobacter falsenii]
MRITELFLNGVSADMYDDTDISYTLQVNDIAELKYRQASFTDSFSIPKTANNIQIMKGLGISSDTSDIPYTKPDCRMTVDGFDLIYKGWFNVKETADDYKVYVYSGIINFFKAIENKTIGDVNLSEINHEKNLITVTTPNPNYCYFIADYNGKTHYNDDIINIDYLQASASVSYLFDKIHSENGFTKKGAIFESEDFKGLFLTYPKALTSDDIIFMPYFDDIGAEHRTKYTQVNRYDINSYAGMLDFTSLGNGIYTVPEKGKYQITIKMTASSLPHVDILGNKLEFYYSVNTQNFPYDERINYSRLIFSIDDNNQATQQAFSTIQNFEIGDDISFFFIFYTPLTASIFDADYQLIIEKVSDPNIDFSKEFSDFSISDFTKEIVNHYGLTMFFEEGSNTVEYLTIDERVNEAELIDLTDKFISRESESYVYNSYAQKNTFEYQYNDKEQTNKNGFIGISNKNLPETKTAFKSKTYAPEFGKVNFFINPNFNYSSDTFKFFDKEIKDDGTIKYKALQKRYFFIRGEKYFGSVKIGSEKLNADTTVNSISLGNFSQLDWEAILAKYYVGYSNILNNSRIHDIELNLSDADLLTFDLRKLYYIGQEQQYYIVNKLKTTKNSTKAEMLRVKFSRSTFIDNTKIIISWINPMTDNYLVNADAKAVVTGTPQNPIWQTRLNNGNWVDLDVLDASGVENIAFNYGTNDVRIKYIKDGINLFSNIISYMRMTDVNKCFAFKIKSPSLGQRTITYINFFGNQVTEVLTFNFINQEINVNAKQIINLNGCTVASQSEIPCPTYVCKRYRVHDIVNSGDTISAEYTDCNGYAQTQTEYASSGQSVSVSFTFCAIEGTVNVIRGNLEDQGIC